MNEPFEIKLIRDGIKRGRPDDYSFEAGHFKDDALEGVGLKEESHSSGGKVIIQSEFGLFHDGLLEGPGFIGDSRHKVSMIGYFEKGKLVNPEDLQGFSIESIEDIHLDTYRHFIVTGVKRYVKKTEYGTIEMVFGQHTHLVSNTFGGPVTEPLKYPFPYVRLALRDEKEEVFSVLTTMNDMGNSYLKISTNNDLAERDSPYLDPLCRFRKYVFEDVRVAKGRQSIDETIYSGPYSVRLFLPHSVKKIIPRALSEAKHFVRLVEVFYDGTKEEWEKIIKDDSRSVTTEDWYGYYYHNAERYSSYDVYSTFPEMGKLIAVHCVDGDILD